MPIGDLLAQIGGNKPHSGGPVNNPRPTPAPVKRKPDQDLRSDMPKTPRFESTLKTSRPTNTSATKPSTFSTTKHVQTTQKPASPAVAAKPTPKKGSFAEILARGKRAQVSMGQVGRIQHKKVEGMPKKPRDDYEEAPPLKRKGTGSGYTGTGKPNSVSRKPGAASGKEARYQGMARPKAGANPKQSLPAEPEKKVKKAAAATTGYSGTARPRPGKPAKKAPAHRGGALLNGPVHRHGSSTSKYDDYDEELDDFIEYDDEEEDDGYNRRGPRYDYASDNSSDMEAGMDDIYDEEQSAERIARREDIEEQRREAQLKAEKEERRRRFMAGR